MLLALGFEYGSKDNEIGPTGFGFRDLVVRRGYYGPGQDAIVMELKLGAT